MLPLLELYATSVGTICFLLEHSSNGVIIQSLREETTSTALSITVFMLARPARPPLGPVLQGQMLSLASRASHIR